MTARQKLPVLKIILALFRRYLLPGVGLPILLINQSLAVPIEHGTIAVTDSSRTLNAVATPGISLGGEINRGDYAVDVDPKGLNNDGVMIASVAENQRNGRYPTVSVFPDGPLERSWIGVYYPSTNSNDESFGQGRRLRPWIFLRGVESEEPGCNRPRKDPRARLWPRGHLPGLSAQSSTGWCGSCWRSDSIVEWWDGVVFKISLGDF